MSVQSLLLERRISLIKKYILIEDGLEDFLCNHGDSLYRLYKLCVSEDAGKKLFSEDEGLFLFEVFFSGSLVYRLNLALDNERDEIDAFMAGGGIPRHIEVVVNDKLFAFIEDERVVVMAPVGNNLGLLQALTKLPIWKRLQDFSYTVPS